MNATTTHTCKSCLHQFEGKFCNNCGEKRYNEKDKKLSHVIHEAFHFITHLDNKFLKTVGLIFFKPGFVSEQYCNGIRKKYFKPISLFLIAVVIYLLFPLLQGMNISFFNHISTNDKIGVSYSHSWALERMAKTGMTEYQLAEKFDTASPKFAKVLLLMLLPLSALPLSLLFRKKRRYFFDHFILATELNTVFLLLFFLLLPLLFIGASKLFGFNLTYGDDPYYGVLQLVLFLFLLTAAFRRFYKLSFLWSILGSLAFVVCYLVVLWLYRQLVFIVVMLSI